MLCAEGCLDVLRTAGIIHFKLTAFGWSTMRYTRTQSSISDLLTRPSTKLPCVLEGATKRTAETALRSRTGWRAERSLQRLSSFFQAFPAVTQPAQDASPDALTAAPQARHQAFEERTREIGGVRRDVERRRRRARGSATRLPRNFLAWGYGQGATFRVEKEVSRC
ncbi:hypothetical protein FA95DRAFT_1152547 [Auriscalpium vulgare]|uniref:Uncharacterized protein n=1 Tax=Auriscalpium vulgare TaxID=40419 RepID=A0ACB8RVM0_9AGAM|nr:hypothetical protein FA95DRAFT_1152547 [Auriscalpium vulgare]